PAMPRGQQIAEFGTEHVSALADDAGHQRQVVVGRQVEVVGQLEVDAAVVGPADGGQKEARLAPVVDGELAPRYVEQGHAEEVEGGTAGGADALLLVDVDAAGSQLPVRVIDVAGGKAHGFHA